MSSSLKVKKKALYVILSIFFILLCLFNIDIFYIKKEFLDVFFFENYPNYPMFLSFLFFDSYTKIFFYLILLSFLSAIMLTVSKIISILFFQDKNKNIVDNNKSLKTVSSPICPNPDTDPDKEPDKDKNKDEDSKKNPKKSDKKNWTWNKIITWTIVGATITIVIYVIYINLINPYFPTNIPVVPINPTNVISHINPTPAEKWLYFIGETRIKDRPSANSLRQLATYGPIVEELKIALFNSMDYLIAAKELDSGLHTDTHLYPHLWEFIEVHGEYGSAATLFGEKAMMTSMDMYEDYAKETAKVTLKHLYNISL